MERLDRAAPPGSAFGPIYLPPVGPCPQTWENTCHRASRSLQSPGRGVLCDERQLFSKGHLEHKRCFLERRNPKRGKNSILQILGICSGQDSISFEKIRK